MIFRKRTFAIPVFAVSMAAYAGSQAAAVVPHQGEADHQHQLPGKMTFAFASTSASSVSAVDTFTTYVPDTTIENDNDATPWNRFVRGRPI